MAGQGCRASPPNDVFAQVADVRAVPVGSTSHIVSRPCFAPTLRALQFVLLVVREHRVYHVIAQLRAHDRLRVLVCFIFVRPLVTAQDPALLNGIGRVRRDCLAVSILRMPPLRTPRAALTFVVPPIAPIPPMPPFPPIGITA